VLAAEGSYEEVTAVGKTGLLVAAIAFAYVAVIRKLEVKLDVTRDHCFTNALGEGRCRNSLPLRAAGSLNGSAAITSLHRRANVPSSF
jgi:hypothetical protein